MSRGNRIKYVDHKFKDNHMITLRSFTSDSTGANYRIVLNLTDNQYYIRNERTKEYVFKSKTYGNMNVLKRNARSELERFGVVLKKEIRFRTFGLCKQGYTQKDHENLEALKTEE